jgi:DNA-binding NtrC family response regulator
MKSKLPYIYIVDDNVLTLKILRKNLMKVIDCKVRTFIKASECLRITELREPSLIISDYYLTKEAEPSFNGDRLLSELKEKHPSIPVIMYSSSNDTKLIVDVISHGAKNFIPSDINLVKKVTKETSSYLEKQAIFSKKHTLKTVAIILFLIMSIVIARLTNYQYASVAFLIILLVFILKGYVFKKK